MKRKLLSLLTAMCLIMTLLPVTALAVDGNWSDSADTSWYTEESTQTEYTLTTAADLAGLAKLVNEGNTFSGKTIKLGADIDLAGKEWTPIGTSDKPFQGTFDGAKEDGGNHTVSNLYINKGFSNTIANNYAGLFGYTNAPATIKNVNFVNVDIQGSLYVGTVVGYGFTGSEISNCHVSGKIEIDGWWYIGGIGGNGYVSKVANCSVTGDDGSYIKANVYGGNLGSYVGGIWGYRGEGNMTISDCAVETVAISGMDRVGGISGIAHYNNTIQSCTITNSTITTENNAGNTGLIAGADLSKSGSIAKVLDCTVTDTTATSKGVAVTTQIGQCDHNGDSITTHATVGSDVVFAEDGADKGKIVSGTLEQVSDEALASGVVAVPQEDGTLKVEGMTTDNAPIVVSVGASTTAYKTLEAAIAAANNIVADNSTVTVTIKQSGNYAPVAITRDNVTVQAADKVKATFTVSDTEAVKNIIKASGVTFKNLNFVSENGASIIYYIGGQNPADSGNDLTLDGCTFTGDGTGTALFIHQPDITITGCTFENFERGYYTCGDNHAAGAMTFTGNTFTNVRVPIDGYWGKTATTNTNIQITGNTFDNGDWDASYIQLWDYAQYLRWAGNQETDRQGSAINATIEDNTYVGKVVIYATHFNWYSESKLTLDEASKALLQYRVLVELENAQSATVRNADGSEITAFNENTTSSNRGNKTVIYAIAEGDYIFDIKPTNSTEGLVTKEVKVERPETMGETSKVSVPADQEVVVAKVGEVEYTSLANAINAAKNGGTVELLANVSVDTWNQVWNAKNLTIKGNGHTITIGKVESNVNGNYLFYGAENLNVSDVTINFKTNGNGFDMVSGKLENVKMYGGTNSNYAVFVGTSDVADAKVEISNCTFDKFGIAVYSQPAGDGKNTSDLSVDQSVFTNCGMTMCSYGQNTVFTNNTVTGGSEISFAAGAENGDRKNSYTVTGNTFQDAGKIWFYGADLGKVEFTQNQVLGDTTVSTEDAKEGTTLDVTENYWGGEAPSNAQLSGTNVTGNDVYYVRDTMNPEDLNTYVAPSSTTYAITVEKADNGTVTASRTRASKNLTITLTVKADEGYKLDSLTVTDKNGNDVKLTDKGSGKYTFAMPASAVTVKATFVKDETPVETGLPFTDVKAGDWFYDAVKYVYDNKLMDGTSSTTFAPLMTTNRAMVVTILWRAAGEPAVDYAMNFSDVESGVWYTEAVRWAASEGIVKGYSDTVFAPDDTVTREQLATILYRYAEKKGYDVSAKGDLATFADGANTSSWAAEAIKWAVGSGLLTGKDGGKLDPTGTATRAEVATILMRFVESVSK